MLGIEKCMIYLLRLCTKTPFTYNSRGLQCDYWVWYIKYMLSCRIITRAGPLFDGKLQNKSSSIFNNPAEWDYCLPSPLWHLLEPPSQPALWSLVIDVMCPFSLHIGLEGRSGHSSFFIFPSVPDIEWHSNCRTKYMIWKRSHQCQVFVLISLEITESLWSLLLL